MRIVVVRHGIAEDREAFARTGQPDEARPLTRKGRRRMRRTARGLRDVAPRIDVVASSPLARARETADILADAFGRGEGSVTLSALVPDAPLAYARDWLNTQRPDAAIALVGHEPHLSRVVGWLLSGQEHAFTELTRGGACLLECDAPVSPGAVRLDWLLRAGQLRRLRQRR